MARRAPSSEATSEWTHGLVIGAWGPRLQLQRFEFRIGLEQPFTPTPTPTARYETIHRSSPEDQSHLSAKPIPPKTAAKLALAERCLLDLRNASESSEAFRRHVANFLTAARSVKDVLINEIAAGDKAVKKGIRPPIEAAMNADS